MVHSLLISESVMKKEHGQQTTTDLFLQRVTPPQEDPQVGPLGAVPEEGIVTDDSCVCAPAALPGRGRDMEAGDGDIGVLTL